MNSAELAQGADLILDAATELFASEGYEAASISAIARLAGKSKANVFHHFESKEALFLAVMRSISTPHAEFVESLLDLPCSSLDKLRRLVDFELLSCVESDERQMRLVMREMSDQGHATARKLARQVFLRNIRAKIALFEQGQASGEFRPDIDPGIAGMMLGAVSHMFMQCRDSIAHFDKVFGEKSQQYYADEIFKVLAAGVVNPAAEVPAQNKAAAAAKRSGGRRSQ